MEEPLFTVVVPATTANMGPGYDSVGMALSLYMTIEIREAVEWNVHYDGEEYEGLPNDATNLIVQTIQDVAGRYGKEVHPHALHCRLRNSAWQRTWQQRNRHRCRH